MNEGNPMRAIVRRGRLSDPRHIELAEPVRDIRGEVEVEIRKTSKRRGRDVFDIVAGLPAGSRSKADIDQQIREERTSWGNR